MDIFAGTRQCAINVSVEAGATKELSCFGVGAKGEQWQQALGLLVATRNHDLLPDAITYSAAMRACGKCVQWQQALGSLPAARSLGVLLDSFTDSVAINVCERCAKWQESLGLLASARNAGLLPYAISYNAAISACEKGEQAGTRLVCSGANR